MGLFSRLKTLVSSNVNDMISKAEKPEKMLNQLLIDMNEQLIESKKAVAMAIADEKKLERETANQETQAKEWERKAMLAVQAGKDDLAKEALLRKQEYDKAAAEYRKQWESQKTSVDSLKESLRDLQNKIEEAQRKKNLLIARAKRAEAQQKIQDTISSVSGNRSAFDAFDRMSAKVDQMEAEADASKELQDLSNNTSLDRRFAELEKSDSSADLLLQDLKEKMKALPDKS
ncbi:PspA/IM30 family protein [Leadbettera azotonutricia]|uniref:Phage shock protein A, PspA n=1 Tax=Leadbettera azotonutricia (strain ATCC BAA-888 / DSM 13862 / ZAS-9) TaxID=545695 RepID=F5YDR1_LEAAZ|nr:PspA/IM30 family protein [Leadbettera azotonutricia]AEF81625.1 phage shock protein A, PspA [Leadbettera azotonutricia ZAS-9]